MKIGILSDVHNHTDNLIAALKIFDREAVHVIVCCGDLGDAQAVPLFTGHELHLVEGNVDHDPRALARAITRLGDGSTFGLEYTATLAGQTVAVLHGHLTERLNEVIRSGLYAYVFHGHTHRRRDERIGATRVINPGALGGKREERRSVAILDLAADQLRVVEIGI